MDQGHNHTPNSLGQIQLIGALYQLLLDKEYLSLHDFFHPSQLSNQSL